MEWKWVKNLLIVLFIILDCFLIYKVYIKNTSAEITPKAVEALETFLGTKNIKHSFKIEDIETKKTMKKINIKNIEDKFLPLNSLDNEIIYSGRNRNIVPITSIIAEFVRQTKIENISIESITLGYYPEINQIDNNVLSGEATPAWRIILDNGEEYIYNAYTSNIIKKETKTTE